MKSKRYLLSYQIQFANGNGHCVGCAFATFDEMTQRALEATAENLLDDTAKEQKQKVNSLVWLGIFPLEDKV